MTLAEVLVALAMLSIGLFGLTESFVRLHRSAEARRLELQAAYLTDDLLASRQAAGYSELDQRIRSRNEDPAQAEWDSERQTAVVGDSTFGWLVHLRREQADGQARIWIEIIVDWPDPLAPTETREKDAIGYVFAP